MESTNTCFNPPKSNGHRLASLVTRPRTTKKAQEKQPLHILVIDSVCFFFFNLGTYKTCSGDESKMPAANAVSSFPARLLEEEEEERGKQAGDSEIRADKGR